MYVAENEIVNPMIALENILFVFWGFTFSSEYILLLFIGCKLELICTYFEYKGNTLHTFEVNADCFIS